MSEQPGRYQRSFSGLIAAIVITLLAIGGFVAVRALVRDDVSNEPDTLDYLETVGLAQDAGYDLIYPRDLPEDWRATSVEFGQGDRPEFGLGILTDEGRFVGLRQEDDDLAELLATYLDEDDDEVTELEPTEVVSEIATQWRVFKDEGGDLAYATQVEQTWVMVYGSAGAADLQQLVERLTTDPR